MIFFFFFCFLAQPEIENIEGEEEEEELGDFMLKYYFHYSLPSLGVN